MALLAMAQNSWHVEQSGYTTEEYAPWHALVGEACSFTLLPVQVQSSNTSLSFLFGNKHRQQSLRI